MRPDSDSGCTSTKTRVLTDAPTEITMPGGGEIMLTTPANMLVRWATPVLNNPEGESTLAIRWGTNGQRCFESGRERFAVDDTSYLVFNQGRRFSSTIDSQTVVDNCTICFDGGLAADILRALITPDDKLLDTPTQDMWPPQINFVEKSTPHDSLVSPYLFKIHKYCETEIATRGWLEECFRDTLVALLQAHRNVFREIETLPAAKQSTRAELYHRLHRARDYMEASLFSPITIPEIASVAWFSPHHFLRLFKHAFGETPHQYLTRRRIYYARHLLTRSEISVTDVCSEIGFESLGSFSLLFRKHVGISPEAYRMQTRRRIHSLPQLVD